MARSVNSCGVRDMPECADIASVRSNADPSCRYGAVCHTPSKDGVSIPTSGPPSREPLLDVIVPMSCRLTVGRALSVYKAGKTPAYDGIAITWFDDTQAMRTSATLPEYETTRADEANFIDGTQLPFIITTEHVIVD